MARYRWAPNGAAYGPPRGLAATVLKVRETCKRDGPDYQFKPPNDGYGSQYHTITPFLLAVTQGLRRASVLDLCKVATSTKGPTKLGHVYLIRKVPEEPKPTYPTTPVYDGMPSTQRAFLVGTGLIYIGGPCKDDYGNIESATILGQSVKLQKPAMDSYIAAANEVGGIKLSGSWRSCAAQTAYYNSDHNRYAPPDQTYHCRALAIDVDTNQFPEKQAQIHAALSKRGWFQARPSDEPWHWSYAGRG